jgi:hypothetical protein
MAQVSSAKPQTPTAAREDLFRGHAPRPADTDASAVGGPRSVERGVAPARGKFLRIRVDLPTGSLLILDCPAGDYPPDPDDSLDFDRVWKMQPRDADRAEGSPPPVPIGEKDDPHRVPRGSIAFWRVGETGGLWVYHRMLIDEADLGEAVLTLGRDLGVDTADMELKVPRIGISVLAALERRERQADGAAGGFQERPAVPDYGASTAEALESPEDSAPWESATAESVAAISGVRPGARPGHLPEALLGSGGLGPSPGLGCKKKVIPVRAFVPPPLPGNLSADEILQWVLSHSSGDCDDDDNCDSGCCGDCCNDPCCGDPCCGDPCCGDPCCNDPCCNDPCCNDPCCEDPCLCVNCDDGNECTYDECAGGQCVHPDKPDCGECPAGFCGNGGCGPAWCFFAIAPGSACPGSSVELTVTGSCEPECGSTGFRQIETVPFLTIAPPGSIPCDGASHERTMTVEVADDAPLGTLYFELEGAHGPVTCYNLGVVEVALDAMLTRDPTAIRAYSTFQSALGSLITATWDPSECEGYLEIVDAVGDGGFVPPSNGSLKRFDHTRWIYNPFEERRDELCPKGVNVHVAAKTGDTELARTSVRVLPIHTWWTTAHQHPGDPVHQPTWSDFVNDHSHLSWKYAAVLATAGVETVEIFIEMDSCVSCFPASSCAYACTRWGPFSGYTITFGTSAFTGSENQAASIMGHELRHTTVGLLAGECPAYQWELDHDAGTGIALCDLEYRQSVLENLVALGCP